MAGHCLRLQDEHGFDVSLGLAALVDGQAGRAWSPPFLAELRATGWDERSAVTSALRHARRLAKPLASVDPAMAELRTAILRQELEAERLAVAWLEERLGPLPDPDRTDPVTASANLRLVTGPNPPQHLLDPLLGFDDG